MKKCSKCFILKSLECFSKHKEGRYGVTSICKPCLVIKHRAYQKANKERIKKYKIEHTYGISYSFYKELIKQQKGLCKICKSIEPKRALAVDHDHNTGLVRGLLCTRCNMFLGRIESNPGFLERVLAYKNTPTEGEHNSSEIMQRGI